MVKRRIAIIPARGGSKRIPKKNIIEFGGKPMIAWTIEAATECGLFDRILVSTDDDEIAHVAKEWGAEVPFLRAEHAGDISPVSAATLTALKQAGQHWDEQYATVVQLMANCPIRDAEDIRNALSAFDKEDRKFQVSCFKFGWMNPWWAVQLDDKGHPEKLFPKAFGARSQDLPDLYCPTGAIWVADVSSFLKEGTFYGPQHSLEPITWVSAIDIDDYDDLILAQAVLTLRNSSSLRSSIG